MQTVESAGQPAPMSVQNEAGFVPAFVRLVIIVTLALSALKILAQGFFPDDDVLADVAKAVSNRPWTDMLVLQDRFATDPHMGWHALLRGVFLLTGMSPRVLVGLCVVSLFVLFSLAPVVRLRFPEAWLGALILAAGAGTRIVERYIRGRPFIISAAALTIILLIWTSSDGRAPKRSQMFWMALVIALSVALHGSWYLCLLPIGAFVVAGEYAWGIALLQAWAAGTVAGAILTGHPLDYAMVSLRMGMSALGSHTLQRTLVAEFQPTAPNVGGLLLIGAAAVLRVVALPEGRRLHRNPVFVLAVIGWVLGYKAMRFWGDWGMVALLVFAAGDIETLWQRRTTVRQLTRIPISLALCATFYLVATNDAEGRWSSSALRFDVAAGTTSSPWLPAPGGTLYSAEMAVFYQTFFANPNAPWKYITGFEPALMPEDDYAVYRRIMLNYGNPLAYAPWADRLRAEDRIVLHWPEKPQLPQLEWEQHAGAWFGRKPLAASAP